ncbi:DUF2375 family protein [Shewanella aestuarii]|uniref:DUF2375 family protein n=1 Tax=Shewanella aestuarii TaxID=1028752 RepID=A0A6G9QQ61_9GAMM|nr:DUF2375 family protein [Shewanella aestuarii]QIR16558.1 DUF2375 family protein [Shewanella aestuarii]
MLNQTMTVTVLFYAEDDPFTLKSAVLIEQAVSDVGRPIFSPTFRDGKTIIAVLKGEVEVINALGQRREDATK